MGLSTDIRHLSPEARARVEEALANAKGLASLGYAGINQGLLKDVDAYLHPRHRVAGPRASRVRVTKPVPSRAIPG